MPAPGFSAPVGNTIRRRDGVSCDGWDCLASGTQFGIVLVFLAVVSVVLYIYYRLIVKPHKNRHDVEMALGRGNTTATRSATAISLELPPPAYQEHVAFRYPQPLIRRRTGLPGRRMTAGFGFNHGNYELQTLEPRHREVRYQATTYLQPPPAVVFWTDPWTAMPPPPPYRPPIVIVPGPPQSLPQANFHREPPSPSLPSFRRGPPLGPPPLQPRLEAQTEAQAPASGSGRLAGSSPQHLSEEDRFTMASFSETSSHHSYRPKSHNRARRWLQRLRFPSRGRADTIPDYEPSEYASSVEGQQLSPVRSEEQFSLPPRTVSPSLRSPSLHTTSSFPRAGLTALRSPPRRTYVELSLDHRPDNTPDAPQSQPRRARPISGPPSSFGANSLYRDFAGSPAREVPSISSTYGAEHGLRSSSTDVAIHGNVDSPVFLRVHDAGGSDTSSWRNRAGNRSMLSFPQGRESQLSRRHSAFGYEFQELSPSAPRASLDSFVSHSRASSPLTAIRRPDSPYPRQME